MINDLNNNFLVAAKEDPSLMQLVDEQSKMINEALCLATEFRTFLRVPTPVNSSAIETAPDDFLSHIAANNRELKRIIETMAEIRIIIGQR